MIITQDLHVHTNLSPCAARDATVESYFEAWRLNGTTTVGIADHLWDESMPNPCPGRTPATGMKETLALKERLKTVDTQGIRVLVGCETEYDYARRGIALSPEAAAQLDFVLVPHDHTHLTMPKELRDDDRKHAKFILDAWYDILNSNIVQYITSMAHPFLAASETEVSFKLSDAELREAMIAARQAGVGIEINAAALFANTKNRRIAEVLALDNMRVLRIAKECGCKFTFGSDAHHSSHSPLFHCNYIVATYLELTDGDIKLI